MFFTLRVWLDYKRDYQGTEQYMGTQQYQGTEQYMGTQQYQGREQYKSTQQYMGLHTHTEHLYKPVTLTLYIHVWNNFDLRLEGESDSGWLFWVC